jgi:hypothetical protein
MVPRGPGHVRDGVPALAAAGHMHEGSFASGQETTEQHPERPAEKGDFAAGEEHQKHTHQGSFAEGQQEADPSPELAENRGDFAAGQRDRVHTLPGTGGLYRPSGSGRWWPLNRQRRVAEGPSRHMTRSGRLAQIAQSRSNPLHIHSELIGRLKRFEMNAHEKHAAAEAPGAMSSRVPGPDEEGPGAMSSRVPGPDEEGPDAMSSRVPGPDEEGPDAMSSRVPGPDEEGPGAMSSRVPGPDEEGPDAMASRA